MYLNEFYVDETIMTFQIHNNKRLKLVSRLTIQNYFEQMAYQLTAITIRKLSCLVFVNLIEYLLHILFNVFIVESNTKATILHNNK
jgi:hypothetical protein